MEHWRGFLKEELPPGSYRVFKSPTTKRPTMKVNISLPSKVGNFRVSPIGDIHQNVSMCKCWGKYDSTIKKAVQGKNIPASAVYAILEKEGTRGKTTARRKNENGTYDVGIAQINDSHIKNKKKDFRKNPKKSIQFAAKLLQKYWDTANLMAAGFPDINRDTLMQMVFAGYNGGEGAMKWFAKRNLADQEMSDHRSNRNYMPAAWFIFNEYGGWGNDT